MKKRYVETPADPWWREVLGIPRSLMTFVTWNEPSVRWAKKSYAVVWAVPTVSILVESFALFKVSYKLESLNWALV